MLAARLTADEIDAHLFDVANQFNRGAALLSDPDEKARVAALNLRAGRKAKASVAYASACGYLTRISSSRSSPWVRDSSAWTLGSRA